MVKTRYFTQAQIDVYGRDGFLVVRNFYTRAEIHEVAGRVDALVARSPNSAASPPRSLAGPPSRGGEMAYFEDSWLEKGKRILSRIEKFCDADERLRGFVLSPRMAGCAAELLGGPAVRFKEKINFKLPGGGGFEPHQDIQPGWDDYAPFFISALITIDPGTVENGCLELAAGHHTRGLIGEKWKPLAGDQLRGVTFTPHPMEPGDVAFFDCFVPHQSKPNLTAEQRRNVYLTFNRLSDGDWREKYFADKRKSYPPDWEREPGKEYVFRV